MRVRYSRTWAFKLCQHEKFVEHNMQNMFWWEVLKSHQRRQICQETCNVLQRNFRVFFKYRMQAAYRGGYFMSIHCWKSYTGKSPRWRIEWYERQSCFLLAFNAAGNLEISRTLRMSYWMSSFVPEKSMNAVLSVAGGKQMVMPGTHAKQSKGNWNGENEVRF